MGFDIKVEMIMSMSPETGKPYYLGKTEDGTYQMIYEIPNITVPDELRKYLYSYGRHFRTYTRKAEMGWGLSVTVDYLLDTYPSWEDVLIENDGTWWTEEDHEGFKKLLQWCDMQDVYFMVTWSY
jgi:hypothetical protein